MCVGGRLDAPVSCRCERPEEEVVFDGTHAMRIGAGASAHVEHACTYSRELTPCACTRSRARAQVTRSGASTRVHRRLPAHARMHARTQRMCVCVCVCVRVCV